VSHTDPMHVWISFSGTGSGQKVFESFDGGLTWVNKSQGLPNVPANSIVAQPDSPNGLYLGTDLGVFYRDDYMPQWEPHGIGLPNVVASELEINMTAGKLRAATYGRGIWEADLYFSPFANVAESGSTPGPRVVALDMEGRFGVQSDDQVTGVRVMDGLGRILLNLSGARANHIDLSAQPGGAFIIEVSTASGRWVRRVIR
jgi:hypothetical protein